MEKVYVVRCADYEQVEEKMDALLNLAGGLSQFVRAGDNIVIKPNLLAAAKPHKAATTHPTVVTAVARLAKQAGAAPVLIDSPGSGYPHSRKTLDRLYRTTGMYDAAQQAGIEVSLDTAYQTVAFPSGRLIRRFEIITPVAQADGVINVCKLKTHSFLSMTGAVKNSFGVVPGLTKPAYHAKLRDMYQFAGMCLDLSACVAPRLSVMDAVIGMEGEGPHGGRPKQVGFLLAAANPLALDIAAGAIMGLERASNPLLVEAEKRGLTPHRLEHIEVVGVDKTELRISDFTLPSTLLQGASSVALKVFGPLLKNVFTARPRVIAARCVGCGACRDACPVHVIALVNHTAAIDLRGCIRCYCCHEMCAYNAITLKHSLLSGLISNAEKI
jgi:uncharacterized protein (DUF362 family)/NAD-dependent dihydropyrimidine dehydrogenase PreA subunit